MLSCVILQAIFWWECWHYVMYSWYTSVYKDRSCLVVRLVTGKLTGVDLVEINTRLGTKRDQDLTVFTACELLLACFGKRRMGNIPDNFQLARPWRRSVSKPPIAGCTHITGQTWWRSVPKWLIRPRCWSVHRAWTLLGVCTLIRWSDRNGGLHPIGWPISDSGLHSVVHLSNLCVPILLLSKQYVFISGLHFADGCYFSI